MVSSVYVRLYLLVYESLMLHTCYNSFEEGAETFCEEHLASAVEVDPTNPEIYQVSTSRSHFRLNQRKLNSVYFILDTGICETESGKT